MVWFAKHARKLEVMRANGLAATDDPAGLQAICDRPGRRRSAAQLHPTLLGRSDGVGRGPSGPEAFETAFADIARRVERLAASISVPDPGP